MAKTAPKGSLFTAPGFSFANGVLTVQHGGTVALTEAADGSWSYSQGANTYVISAAEVNQISTINVANNGTSLVLGANALVGDSFTFTGKGSVQVDGLGFVTADAASNSKFEPTVNLDSTIAAALGPNGNDAASAVASLSGLFGEANAIRLVWDYVDDHYSYYDTTINTAGVQLGLVYADYLQAGGAPITDIAKFTPDGADAGTAPDRSQTMHDNLLGNLDVNSIIDKFFDGNPANGAPAVPDPGYFAGGSNGGANGVADEATGQALLNAVFAADLDGRPYYSGAEGASSAATVSWDYAHGLL